MLRYHLSGTSSNDEEEATTSNEHAVHVFVGLTGEDLTQNAFSASPVETTSFLDTVLLRDDQGKVTANMKQMFNKAIEQHRTIENLSAFVFSVLCEGNATSCSGVLFCRSGLVARDGRESLRGGDHANMEAT